MATATFTLAADFKEGAMEAEHNLASNTIMIALSNTAPASEASNPLTTGNGSLSNVTQVAYTNYEDNLTVDRTLESVTSNESGGTYTFDAADFQIVAGAGGAIADFQYIYVYNDTSTTPDDQIIGVLTVSQTISLATTQTCDVSFNASGIFTAA